MTHLYIIYIRQIRITDNLKTSRMYVRHSCLRCGINLASERTRQGLRQHPDLQRTQPARKCPPAICTQPKHRLLPHRPHGLSGSCTPLPAIGSSLPAYASLGKSHLQLRRLQSAFKAQKQQGDETLPGSFSAHTQSAAVIAHVEKPKASTALQAYFVQQQARGRRYERRR